MRSASMPEPPSLRACEKEEETMSKETFWSLLVDLAKDLMYSALVAAIVAAIFFVGAMWGYHQHQEEVEAARQQRIEAQQAAQKAADQIYTVVTGGGK